MKLLMDQGLPRSTVRYLRDYGMIVDHMTVTERTIRLRRLPLQPIKSNL